MSTLITPVEKDLGGFAVRRLLPARALRMLGPFVFFDHVGPATFAPGAGVDVRPHPHIGLATVTWLFEGALLHRDSLGSVQRIEPGDVNWMTAGRGIVHSERTDAQERASGHRLHGIQTWVALPVAHEQTAPAFTHVPAAQLPLIELPGVQLRLLVGTALGGSAPTPSFSPIFCLAGRMQPGSRLTLPPEHAERGVYLASGELTVDGVPLAEHHLLALDAHTDVEIAAGADSLLMLLGGAPIDGERVLWWNFVASSRTLIDAAQQRWQAQALGKVPGETEFIPLPEH